jgi:hypothetical protein
MAEDTHIDDVQKKLEEIPGLSDRERDLLTSDTLIKKIMPVMGAFMETNIKANKDNESATTKAIRDLAEKTLASPGVTADLSTIMSYLKDGLWDGSAIDKSMDILREHWLFGPIMSVAIILMQIMGYASAYMGAASEKARQGANEDIQPFLLDVETLTEVFYRYPDSYNLVMNEMLKMGISDKKANIFLDTKLNQLPVDTLRFLYNRDLIDDGELDERLLKLRVNPEDIDNLKETFKVYPGPGDFVSFAVREVFSSEVSDTLGLNEGLPPEFVEEVRKTGMDEKYARMFWAAHWTPPSITNAFDMFHRKVIELEELQTLLKVQDYMPNYRDKLVEIAYKTPGRVDIRRFFRDGNISFDEMVELYEYNGLAPKYALLMAEWTEDEYGEESKERTKADVIGMYKIGLKTRQDSFELLQGVGYPSEIAEELIKRVDLEKADKKKAAKVKLWKKGFKADFYTESQVKGFMSGYGMQISEVEDLLDDWKIEKQAKLRLLNPAELKTIYKADLLTASDLISRLVSLGYPESDATLLQKAWSGDNEQKG